MHTTDAAAGGLAEVAAAGLPAALLTRLPAAVAFLAGPDLVFSLINEAYQRLIGDRDVLGKPFREALPEVVGQGYLAVMEGVYASGEAAHGQGSPVFLRGADGALSEAFVDYVCQPVLGGGGETTGILVHAVDVTDHVVGRRRLEDLAAELRDTEERHRALFQTMLHGVVFHGPDGAILVANPAAGEILGVDPADLVGLHPDGPNWNAVREDGTGFPGSEHPAMQALRTGEVVSDVLMGVSHGRTGERRWLGVTAVPISPDEHGRPRRVYTMFRDLTQQRRTAAALQDRDALLGRLRDGNVLGVTTSDETGVFDANDAFLGMLGLGREEFAARGVDWQTVTAPEGRARDREAVAAMRSSGVCRPFETVLVALDGRRVPVLVGSAVVERAPLRWVSFVADLSERERAEQERARLVAEAEAARISTARAEEQLELLLRAGAMAAATHDPGELLLHANRLVVPTLADFAAVLLPDPAGALRVADAVHTDPGRSQPLHGLRVPSEAFARLVPEGGAGPATGKARLVLPERSSPRDASQWRLGPGLDRVLQDLDATSAVTVPLSIGDRRFGLGLLGRCDGRAAFTRADLGLVEELTRRITAGLTNADTFARDHSLAVALQRAVLPDALPDVDGLDLEVRYLPATVGAEVGGDWYDAFEVSPGRVFVVLGDVTGHNLASAAAMAQIRNAIRTAAVLDPDPATVLSRTNEVMVRLMPDVLATAVVAVLDVARGELVYANAGHPPPVLSTPDGPTYLDQPSGLILGVQRDVGYARGRVSIDPPGVLLLFSDGLVEDRARSLDQGFAALAAALSDPPPASAAEACTRATEALFGAGPRADDVCLLAVHVTG